ncbi:peptide ABC transporter substrate-binding protein [Carnobacterium divergens]|uniref:peptide ABC transporter substrate-binding protein n=1 Tax=Carnobacterium divergens TaxID=2748 RepID=UPI0039C8D91D
MKIKRLISMISPLILTGVVLVGCGKTDEIQKEATLRTTALSELSTLDNSMAIDGVSQTAVNAVFEGLYHKNKKGEPVLGVAKEEPKISEDGKTVTFKLREDAQWSDQSPVVAGDFVFAWKKMVDPTIASPNAQEVINVLENGEAILLGDKRLEELGVRAIDEHTLELKLVKPIPYLSKILCTTPFMPQKESFATEKGKSYGQSSKNIISNGAFLITNWSSSGTEWNYKKNPTYWDNENVKLDKIKVDVIKETSTAVNLFDNDELDLINIMNFQEISENNKSDLVNTPTSSISGLLLNQEKNGQKTPFDNLNIRKAIALSIDKKGYTKLMDNGSKPLNGLIPPDLVTITESGKDFRKTNGNYLTLDTKEAKEYWEKGLREIGQDQLELEILADDIPSAKRSVEYLQDQLQNSLPGLTIKTRNVPFKNRLEAFMKQDYDIMLQGYLAGYDDPICYLELFETGNEYNKNGFHNETYDDLIDKSKSEDGLDAGQRMKDLMAAEKILMNDVGFVPIYQKYNAFLKKENVKGVVFPITGTEIDYRYVSIN